MVEMHYPLKDDREKFNEFYHKHISMLLTIEGFISAQRYECIHETDSPFLAIYKQRDTQVITSLNYTSRAGRDSVDPAFKLKMTNWHRNLVEGSIDNMDVRVGGLLTLIDRLTSESPDLPESFTSLKVIGLDSTIFERGVVIRQNGNPCCPNHTDGWNIRTFRPIHPPRFSEH